MMSIRKPTAVLLHLITLIAQGEYMCTPSESAPATNVTIVTTIPSLTVNKNTAYHFREVLLAIGENTRNSYVESVYVLIDNATEIKNLSMELRARVHSEQVSNFDSIDAPATKSDLGKLHARLYGKQPTYSDIFRFVSRPFLADKIVAVQNADIVLRNLHVLNASAFRTDLKLAFAISVRPPSGRFRLACEQREPHIPIERRDRCEHFSHAGWSFDSFIFSPPLRLGTMGYYHLDIQQPNPVYMNQPQAEDRAARFLRLSGYTLQNPCLYNLSEHWHCSPKTHRGRSARISHHGQAGLTKVPVSSNVLGLRCTSHLSNALL